nr:MAG TPA_asm: hypothetical protein [Caudoviricetes sp.]
MWIIINLLNSMYLLMNCLLSTVMKSPRHQPF